MKISLVLFLCFWYIGLHGQQTTSIDVIASDSKKITFSAEQLKEFKTYLLDSLVITNHAGKYKGTLKDMTGVLLKDVLAGMFQAAESPKVLSEYYLICKASDGYKVTFSWNELFNTAIGDRVLIVTSIAGPDFWRETTLALVSPKDIATGRRYVKQLQEIRLVRVD